ncbi:hypothetical protein [Celeribacter sp.]|uniref:hypothetical protein n=1 Tax=Celeribacter sp. TaxID=1890673 RepID=UPI003A94AB68
MTQAYPLQWPTGRPRTKSRGSSKFSVTPRKAFTELMDELSRFGAATPVVSTNCALRQDGTPYADALDDSLPDPGVAVYFTRKKRLVCLACDTYKLPFENLRAIGLSIKSLRDMDRWGAGQVLDQAFEGFTALPPPSADFAEPAEHNQAWWEVLKVGADADNDTVHKSYRDLCKSASEQDLYKLNAAKEAWQLERGLK